MKKFLLVAAATLAIQTPVHALFGIGVSGGINTTSIGSANQTISGADAPVYFRSSPQGAQDLVITREKLSNLTQIGVKAWLEIPLLPIEFEAGTNLAWGSYKSTLKYGTTAIPVDVKSPLALGEDKDATPYVSLLTDVTIRYPLIKIPPVLNTLKIYVGAGATHVLATRVIDKTDIQKSFGSSDGIFDPANPDASKSVVEDNLLQSTFGGHLSVGAQVKVPVLPIAFFVDGKWYINTAVSDAASNYPFAVSAGVGFAL